MLNPRNMSNVELLRFTLTLSSLDWKKFTPRDYKRIAIFINSDGCTDVPDFYLNGCIQHDWWFRTHRNFDGSPITEEEANQGLRDYVWHHSLFGHFSPLAWWRYYALEVFGKKAWDEMPPLISGVIPA